MPHGFLVLCLQQQNALTGEILPKPNLCHNNKQMKYQRPSTLFHPVDSLDSHTIYPYAISAAPMYKNITEFPSSLTDIQYK